MTKISIIVPVYNVDKYLENCVESILNQTFKDFELILVDDGSTDNSGIICDEYKNKDSRIQVIHKENRGLSSARNVGLDRASGKYIGFVDSDDYIHPQMYEILYKYIELNSCDISICNFKNVYDLNYKYENIDVNKISTENFYNKGCLNQIYRDKALKFIVMWNKIFKRELFDNLRFEEGRIYEDEFIVHKLLYKCLNISYIDKELYFYFQRDESIMNTNFSIKNLDAVDALADRVYFLYRNKIYNLCETSVCQFLKVYFKNYYKLRDEIKNSNKYLLVMKIKLVKIIAIIIKTRCCNYKEILGLIIFCINSRIYEQIFNFKSD